MADPTTRLRAQNRGETWLDCEARDLKHRWVLVQVLGAGAYERCLRCPVRRRTERKEAA